MGPNHWRERRRELEVLQPWPRYYDFRSREMDIVAALCELPRGESMLELGCGNAFHSYLLSDRFDSIIATDLYATDSRTHTIGLHRARRLAEVLEMRKLRLVACSAEALSLESESQDFIFSSNVLEHLPDQRRAVREIFRVLKPGGKALSIVPAAMERVYNLPASYLMILTSVIRGAWRLGAGKVMEGQVLQGEDPVPGAPFGFWSRARRFFRKHYPTFPFPKPHGQYHSSTEEFLSHRPVRWNELFTSCGFTIERTFSTILAPHSLGLAFSPRVAYWLARLGWPLTRRLGDRVPFKFLGTSYAIFVSKPVGGEEVIR